MVRSRSEAILARAFPLSTQEQKTDGPKNLDLHIDCRNAVGSKRLQPASLANSYADRHASNGHSSASHGRCFADGYT